MLYMIYDIIAFQVTSLEYVVHLHLGLNGWLGCLIVPKRTYFLK